MPSVTQTLHLANGKTLTDKLKAPGGPIDRWIADKKSDDEIISELYFAALGRAYAIYDSAGNGRRSADALDEAARSFAKYGCYPDAIKAESVALGSYRDNYGPEHVTSADALARLGTYLRDSGQTAEAIQRFGASIALFDRLRKEPPCRHPFALASSSTT